MISSRRRGAREGGIVVTPARLAKEARRLAAVPDLERPFVRGQFTARQLAKKYGVRPSTIYAWRRRLRAGKLKGRNPPGARPKLSHAEVCAVYLPEMKLRHFVAALRAKYGARAYTYRTACRVLQILKQKEGY
jgi:transposase